MERDHHPSHHTCSDPACGAGVDPDAPRCAACRTTMPEGGWPVDARLAEGCLIAGRYALLRRVGSGAYGAVYLATDQNVVDRPCAIKILTPIGGRVSDIDKKRFLREIQALVRLDSGFSSHVYDAGTLDDGTPWMAQEFINGVTLQELITQEGRLDVLRALRMARSIAVALEDAHRLGVLHRDLKPGNIMVEQWTVREERVRVLDFGLALLDGGSLRSSQSGPVGTPLYMAPEQIHSASEPRSDLFALGAVLYECLTGKPAFDSGPGPHRVLGVYHRILHGDRIAPSAHRPGLPQTVDDFVLELLAAEVDRRPRDASTVIAQVDALVESVKAVPDIRAATPDGALQRMATVPDAPPPPPGAHPRRLREDLARLYETEDTVRQVLDDAALATGRIDLSGAPEVRWSRVLREVRKMGPRALASLRAAIEADYPDRDLSWP